MNYFRLDCQNYSLRVQRSTVRKVIFFWEFFKRVFGLWAIIVRTSGEKLQQRCPNCPKKVSSVLSKLHSKRWRIFWGNFLQKHFFSIDFGFWGNISWPTSEKFPAELSKLFSTCPVDHFENDYRIFWNIRKFLVFER